MRFGFVLEYLVMSVITRAMGLIPSEMYAQQVIVNNPPQPSKIFT